MRLVIIVLMVSATPHYTKILALAQERGVKSMVTSGFDSNF